jgi:hypothetical protein
MEAHRIGAYVMRNRRVPVHSDIEKPEKEGALRAWSLL